MTMSMVMYCATLALRPAGSSLKISESSDTSSRVTHTSEK